MGQRNTRMSEASIVNDNSCRKSKGRNFSDSPKVNQPTYWQFDSGVDCERIEGAFNSGKAIKRILPKTKRDLDDINMVETADKLEKNVNGGIKGKNICDKMDEELAGKYVTVNMTQIPAKKRKKGADAEMVDAYLSSPEKPCSRLRPRKQVPSFRKVTLNEHDYSRIVGRRIKVFWPLSRKWFFGRVDSFDMEKKVHKIVYDDGDREVLNLMKEQFELEIMSNEFFVVSTKQGPECDSDLKKDINDVMENEHTSIRADADFAVNRASVAMNEVHKVTKSPAKKRRKCADGKMVDAYLSSPEKDCSRLRLRKQDPSFRRVAIDKNDYSRIVGRRVKVFWPLSRKWFYGHVGSVDLKKRVHEILYDDGDREMLNLMEERFELEVMPDEAFGVSVQRGPELFKKDIKDMMERKDTSSKADVLGGKYSADAMSEVQNINKSPTKKRRKGPDEEIVDAYLSSPEKAYSRLRPRKQVPSFRKVTLNENDCSRIVGKRVKVFWPLPEKWFHGHVGSLDQERNLHEILYDDGNREMLNLREEQFELEVLPDVIFGASAKQETKIGNHEMHSEPRNVALQMNCQTDLQTKHARTDLKMRSEASMKGTSSQKEKNGCELEEIHNANMEAVVLDKSEDPRVEMVKYCMEKGVAGTVIDAESSLKVGGETNGTYSVLKITERDSVSKGKSPDVPRLDAKKIETCEDRVDEAREKKFRKNYILDGVLNMIALVLPRRTDKQNKVRGHPHMSSAKVLPDHVPFLDPLDATTGRWPQPNNQSSGWWWSKETTRATKIGN